MAIRRSITWYRVVSGDHTMPAVPTAELVALLISVLMLAGVILIGRLFREARENATALQEALTETERADQAKSKFLATMSHEFRTPLNAILGFSEMLGAQYFGPLGSGKYEEYAKDINQSGRHMLALVDDILDFSAIEAGKRSLAREAIAAGELLELCIRNVERAADDKGIALSLDVPEGLPPLNADRRAVTQIVLNILSNAVKFTPPNGSIAVFAMAADRGMTIGARDSGVGIQPDRLPDVVQPFSQVHSNPHLTQEGTGLGLSIVKALVDAHNGDLDIESEVGTGTTVTVTFPPPGHDAG